MNKSIKSIFVSILLLCSTTVFAQGVDIVTLTTMGEGRTQSEAVTNALRNAIEQAFGAFVSSRTDIVNDELIRDEIVSVASGNIRRHNVLSSVALPNGYTAVTVRADVSVARLTAFSQGRGIDVEFAGATFGANIRLMQLYENNTRAVLNNLITTIEGVIMNCFDFTISVSDPVRAPSGSYRVVRGQPRGEKWQIAHTVYITPNRNMENIHRLVRNTLSGISMNEREIENYIALGKKNQIVPIAIVPNNRRVAGWHNNNLFHARYGRTTSGRINTRHIEYFYLRTGREQINRLQSVIRANKFNFVVDNGISSMPFNNHRELLARYDNLRISSWTGQHNDPRNTGRGSDIRHSFSVEKSPMTRRLTGNTNITFRMPNAISFQTRDWSGRVNFTLVYDLSEIERIQTVTVRPIIE